MRDWLPALREAVGQGPVVRVVVTRVRGSAPREAGASMLVAGMSSPRSEPCARTPGSHFQIGTIGGGHLELVATRIALDMLAAAEVTRHDRFPLAASLGQCCGGIVELRFERYDLADAARLDDALRLRDAGAPTEAIAVLSSRDPDAPRYERFHPDLTELWLFGAGHVGRALVNVLAPLPFRITWIDSREDVFAALVPGNVRTLGSPRPQDEVADMPAGAWALVMTHSHDEDLAICEALLEHAGFGWAGVIGSKPKAARFRQRLSRRFAAGAIARLAMPIGIGGIASKEPAAIAVAVAAQLLQLREARGAAETRDVATP